MTALIAPVDERNLEAAAEVYAISWRASHADICTPEFIDAHTTDRQREYLRKKLQGGGSVFLLRDQIPIGLVTVTGNLIEDLYVLPQWQGRGFGTLLLQHAIRACAGTPTLWILETNQRARRLYERQGFHPTGRVCRAHGPLAEIELSWCKKDSGDVSQGETMEYRRIHDSQIGQLWKLHTEYKAEIGEKAPTAQDCTRLQAAMEHNRILFYGAWDGETLVGCCSVTVGFSTFLYAPSGVFEDFYIRPEYRHRGIARSLVRFAHRDSGVSSLTVGCADCDLPMYQALGFSVPLGNLLAFDG